MAQPRTLWSTIVNSRLLAGIGVLALLITGGITISSLASAQGVTYTTITTTDVQSLQQQINSLHNRVTTLENRVATLEAQVRTLVAPRQTYVPPKTIPTTPTTRQTYTSPPIYTTTTYPVIEPVTTGYNTAVGTGRVVIDQNGGRYVEGYTLYFTGRGFAPNEQILISRNGVVVGHAMTDGAGGFSSNGVFLPLGTNSYVFSGQSSGVSAVATVRGVDDVINP